LYIYSYEKHPPHIDGLWSLNLLNRPPQETQLKVFSNLYESFKAIDLDWKVKYAGFERILFDSKLVDHWIITGITHKALECIANNNFSKKNTGVVRGHILDRRERAKKLFENNGFESSTDAFNYFMENDTVTLVTKAENGIKKSPSDWSKVYPIDSNLFPYRCGYATVYTDEALDYFRTLAKDNIRI
tara:strand:+ start:122 stop:682 length:561 start_codon:yes stop_codon:yes gene_type:complete